jgi:hypothetical protein
MRVTFLCHSSFIIEAGNNIVLFDPWLQGPAYHKQWFLYPRPNDISLAEKANIVIYSHGHEDHMHPQSMELLNKNADVFFPFQWREGIKPYLKHRGFKNITEAVSFKTYTVNDTKITFLGYSLESVIVIEHEGEVLVNINDALNSNHENASNYLLKQIKERWPKIDYLFSGWSGASYFPNKVKYKNKNDVETGKIREQFFAHNFCIFSNYLNPKTAIPFPPGFVLLTKENDWINHVKFDREIVPDYYKKHFETHKGIHFIFPWPDDIIENHQIQKISGLHQKSKFEIENDYRNIYSKEIQEANTITYVDESFVFSLEKELNYWLNKNKILYHENVLKDASFTIQLTDTKPVKTISAWYENKSFYTRVLNEERVEKNLHISTKAALLKYSLAKVWGGDVLTIGYGLEVEMYDELSLEKNLDIVCVRLITRYPIARRDLFKYPFRAVKYYLKSPGIASLWLKQKIILKPYVNKFPYNERDHWISYNKCDLCKVCKIPQVF